MNYIIAYSYYEKYVNNLLEQTRKICENLSASHIIFVSTHQLDLASLYKKTTNIKCCIDNLRHDNKLWEFGGYQIGLDHLRDLIKQGDSLYIINDTAGIHSFLPMWIIKRFKKLTSMSSNVDSPVIVGELDRHYTDSDLRVLNMDANKWIRSCVFSLNYAALESISWKFSHADFIHSIIKKNDKNLSLKPIANIALELRINNWLFNEAPENRWQSSVGYITDANFNFIKNKALSILSEKVMSAAIFESNGRLVNFIPDNKFIYNVYRLERRVWYSLKKIFKSKFGF